jgi:hypothetical protein
MPFSLRSPPCFLPSPLPTGSFLGLDDDPPHVVAARAADPVRGHGLAAGRAKRQLTGRKKVMRPAGPGLLIRLTSLGNGHEITYRSEG